VRADVRALGGIPHDNILMASRQWKGRCVHGGRG
jgi:hypothetical protein